MAEQNSIRDVSRRLAERAEDFCKHFFPNGKRIGNAWCIADTLGGPGDSLQIILTGPKAGLWCDRANDNAGGDLISLYAENRCISNMGTAANELRPWLGMPKYSKNESKNGDKPAPPVFDPLKKSHPNRTDNQPPRFGSAFWTYHDESGQPIAHVVRFNKPDGTKDDVLPMRFLDGQWRWKGWTKESGEKTPLYNLHLLKSRPDAAVLIVEGEKTADAAAKLFPDFVCVTWPGGCSQVQKADWSTIISRKTRVALWPDADEPGRKAMLYLKARIPHAAMVPTHSLPPKWDLADPIPPGISLHGLMDAAFDPPRPAVPTEIDAETPFRLLGYTHEAFLYIRHLSGVITTLSAAEHTEMNLCRIAPSSYWESRYQGRTDTDWKLAGKDMMERNFALGYFDESRIRGLGCWLDDNRVVFHAGDRLFVDGKETPLHKHKSSYIYPRRPALKINLANPLTAAEAAKVLELSRLLPWQNQADHWLLPSWIVCALICGVLDWRPHAWLFGGSGTGKSWTYTNIIARLLGVLAIKVQSSTSEAGIRHSLNSDALAVQFDEAETNNDRARSRMTSILELVRQSSSETGGSIVKGSALGKSVQYKIRSCFIFSSIASGAIEVADQNRITPMAFIGKKTKTPDAEIRWSQCQKLWSETLASDEFCARFQARFILMAMRIREASIRLTAAISKHAKDARIGQQLGPLCAAFWYLQNDTDPTEADILTLAETTPIERVTSTDTQETDENRVLDILCQSTVEVAQEHGSAKRLSINELLNACFEDWESNPATVERDALLRHGIYVPPRGEHVDIANKHPGLTRIFSGSPYDERWRDYLLRVDGAQAVECRPGKYRKFRAVRIPRDAIRPDDPMI